MKKAQMKMMESVMVLIVFFFLLGIGFIFYGSIQGRSISQSKIQQQQKDALLITQEILYLQELGCTEGNVPSGVCLDLYKAFALQKKISEDEEALTYYRRKFQPPVRISYRPVYPSNGSFDVIYEPDPEDIDELRDRALTELPITLKDPSRPYNPYSIGIIRVEVFSSG